MRREFFASLLAGGAVTALSPALLSAMQSAAGQVAPPEPDPDAVDFWNGFLTYKTVPAAKVPTGPAPLKTRGGNGGLAREPFFFHHGRPGLHAAVDIPPSELIDDGDVTVSLNVTAFKPAVEDRETFERLQSAQLRIDFVQDHKIIEMLDMMAWTAVAVLRPDKQKKLPPIQSLSFDPASTWDKMQNILLPRGQGKWAVNLYAQRSEGLFSQILNVLTKEIGRFAPVLGLPGVSVTALQSFNQLYGALHNRPEYLLQSNPVPVFATAAAAKQSGSSRGLPLRSGTYIMVPVAQAGELTDDTLAKLELKQGLIVPKNTAAVKVYEAALDVLPKVSYATIDVVVKPVKVACGDTGRGGRGGNPDQRVFSF
jgi:hypothetical protein